MLGRRSCQLQNDLSAGQVSDIADLTGPEAFDTASIIVRFENGKDATIDVCRQA